MGAGNCRTAQVPPAPQAPPVAADLPVQTVQANNLKFAYIEAGEGPLVLLLHGFPESARTWQAVMPALALMDAFGAPRAIVIGHDWGASVAMATANLAPTRVEKLVTLGIPPPRVISVSPRILSCLPHFVVLQFGGLSEWWAARDNFSYIKKLYAYWSPELELSAAQLQEIDTDFSRPGRLAAAIAYYHFGSADQSDPRRTALYNRIMSVPTLAFAGTDDLLWQLGMFDHSASAFSGPFQLIPVAHAGHFIQLDQPKLFEDQLLQFLAT